MARFTVLLVEDDDPLRQCLADVLAGEGWRVHATGSGSDAIELARAVLPDFSLLDLHLPGMSGLDVLREIACVRPIPSIMMSGQATSEERQTAFDHGVFRFLAKPLDLSHLRGSFELLIRYHFGPQHGGPRR